MTAATIETSPGSSTSAEADPQSATVFWFRPVVIAAILLAGYFSCTLVTDPGGYLSTDTGGKVATLDAMTERGDLRPDLGYWAESVDPDGSLYPMFSTLQVNDQWVNVTSMPMLYLALPLYALGGYTLALLVPMLGGVATAWAAGRMARQLDVGVSPLERARRAAVVMAVVGLATPVAVYSLDLWEHTLGVALMMWGSSWVLDLCASPRVVLGAGAGLAFGAAATMRQEALVYGLVAGVLVLGLGLKQRSRSALMAPVAMAGAALLMLLGGVGLEEFAMGGSVRTGRSAGTATASGGEAMLRLHEAIVTFGSINRLDVAPAALLAGLLVAGFALIVTSQTSSKPSERVRWGSALLACVYLVLAAGFLSDGLSFVSGMLLASPIAGIGLVAGARQPTFRFAWALAVAPLPLVWYFQYTGGAGPQWGGRYILLTGTILVVIGLVELGKHRRAVAGALLLLSLSITLVGVAWLGQRSSGFAAATQALADRSEPVLIFADPHTAREAGPLARQNQWFAASSAELRVEAATAVDQLGIDRFGFVSLQTPIDADRASAGQSAAERIAFLGTDFADYEAVGVDRVEVLPGVEFEIITFLRR